MKKTTRTLLGIGGAFCLIGALLFGIGFVSGGTKYVHATNLNTMNAQSDQDAKENHFTLEKTEEYRSTLVIVNTTKCAFEVFQKLEDSCTEEYEIFHLSNNMCPQHKLDTLKEIRNALNQE